MNDVKSILADKEIYIKNYLVINLKVFCVCPYASGGCVYMYASVFVCLIVSWQTGR